MESESKKVYLNLPKYLYSDSDSDVELVPVSELLKFREFDRLQDGKFSKQESYDNIKLLEDVYKNEGITSVLIIEYSVADNKVLLIEGNHRLNVALELGVRYLPARVVKRNSSFPSLQSKKAMKVIGVVPDKYGYVRSNLKPSAVGIQGTKSIIKGDESIYENGGQILLAPNGKVSNLTPEQYKLVRTPEFINWFGDWETLAKAKLLGGNITGFYKRIFKDNEEQFLFEMAVQSNTLDAKNGAIDVAGKELINLAIKLFPNSKVGDVFNPIVSKVVDDNGEPMVVYHGSNIDLNIFKSISNNFFFSNNKDVANRYRSKCVFKEDDEIGINENDYDKYKNDVLENKVKIYNVFLNIRNPKVKDFEGNNWLNDTIEKYIDKNKDGFFAKNIIDGANIIANTYVVFNPNQIKLADGRNTIFDSNNPDIRFEEGGSLKKENTMWLQTMPNLIKEMKKRDGDVQPESYYERMAKSIIGSHIGASIFNYGEAIKQKLITIDEAKKIIRSADFDIPNYIKELENKEDGSKSLITSARKMQLRNKLADIIKTLDYKTVDIHSGKSKEDLFIQRVVDMIYDGYDFKSKLDIERIATKEFGFDDAKKVRELTEYAILFVGRDISKENDVKETYDKLVSLYANQPYSTNRTVKSQELGQFSTPAPMAYLMGIYVGIDKSNINWIKDDTDAEQRYNHYKLIDGKNIYKITEYLIKDKPVKLKVMSGYENLENETHYSIDSVKEFNSVDEAKEYVKTLLENNKPINDLQVRHLGYDLYSKYYNNNQFSIYDNSKKEYLRDNNGDVGFYGKRIAFKTSELAEIFLNKYLKSKTLDRKKLSKIYIEPTAGNGMLTIAGNPSDFVVNELDFNRYNNLLKDNYKQVLNLDATKPLKFDFKFDGLLANPPFATTKNDLVIDNFKISGLENQIIINTLGLLKDDARGAFIVGGHTEYDNKGRLKSLKDRIFLSYLFSRYNVDDVINVSGTLYGRQGTTFPIRIILFNGRKSVPEGFFPIKNDKLSLYDPFSTMVINNFDELYKRFEKTLLKTR